MVLSSHFQEIPFKEEFQQLKHYKLILKCVYEFLNSFLTMLKKTDFLEKGSFPLWDSKVHLAHKASLTNVHGIGSSAFSEAFSHLVKNALSFFPQHDLVEKNWP